MKLDPGIHIAMHSVLSLKPGVTNLLRKLGWESVSPFAHELGLVAWWTVARKSIHKDNWQCFDSVVILVSWMLWKERSNRTFERIVRSVLELLGWVVEEIVAWYLAGFRWLEHVVSALGRSPGRTLSVV